MLKGEVEMVMFFQFPELSLYHKIIGKRYGKEWNKLVIMLFTHCIFKEKHVAFFNLLNFRFQLAYLTIFIFFPGKGPFTTDKFNSKKEKKNTDFVWG